MKKVSKINNSRQKTERIFQKLNNYISMHAIIFSILFSLVVSSVCVLGCAYKNNDNCIISIIINGSYGADNYCIFMNYFFCKLVKFINGVFPYADGYILICRVLLYLSTFWVSYLVLKNTQDIFKRILLLMTLITVMLGFGFADVSNQNFTIQAASIAAVGVLSVFTGIRHKKCVPYLTMAIIFFVFAAMIRMAACLLTIPYLLLHMGIELICSKDKEKYKRIILLAVIPLVFVAGICCLNTGINKSEKYASFYEFNNARSKSVDRPRKSWDVVKDKIPELTENDYASLQFHLYGDTERYDTAFFKKIYEVSKADKEFNVTNIINSFNEARSVLLQGRTLLYVFIATLSLFIIGGKFNIWRKIELICAFVGTLIISTWFAYNGRIVFRICAPLIIMYCVIAAYTVLDRVGRAGKITHTVLSAGMTLLSVFVGIALIFGTLASSAPSFSLYAKYGADETPFKKSYETDDLYVWDTFTIDTAGYGYFVNQGKLPTKSFVEHNIPQGEYTYGQAFTNEYFDKIGTHNPVRALLERNNTYYVAENVSMMETYIKEHVNINAYAKRVDTIDLPTLNRAIPVWKFEVG